MMLNNGGGLFNADGKPDVRHRRQHPGDGVRAGTRRREGSSTRRAVSYTTDNLIAQWNEQEDRHGHLHRRAWSTDPGAFRATSGHAAPLTGPERRQRPVWYFQNNLMMYANTPSQEASEAFLASLHRQHEDLLGRQRGRGTAGAEVDRRLPSSRPRTPKVKIIAEVGPGRQDLRRTEHDARSPRWPQSTAARPVTSSRRPSCAARPTEGGADHPSAGPRSRREVAGPTKGRRRHVIHASATAATTG